MAKKIKRLAVSPEALVSIMSAETAWRVSIGVPSGSQFRGATIDPYANMFFVFIEHDSFEPIEDGVVYPVLKTELRRIA